METILAAYNEIALKSRGVRNRLEKKLSNQIQAVMVREGFKEARVLRRYGRLYVENVPLQAAEYVAEVFGVASAMPALRTSSDIDSILGLLTDIASERMSPGTSFAIRPRVVGSHSYRSRDIAVKGGSAVLDALSDRQIHVDLTHPDTTFHVEVRDRDAFVYTEIIQGVGGLPYASQGRLVSLFSGGIDSPIATWLMMKRGVETLPLMMDQRPYVGENYIERAVQAAEKLGRYDPTGKMGLYLAPFGGIMERISEASSPSLRCVLCKRSMYRVAEAFALKVGARGVITGESLGQVASQTLDNLYVLDGAVSIPVLRPIIGLDKVEIEGIARRIGTYDLTAVSVDGCTVVPERPTTRARMEAVVEMEGELGLVKLCSEAADRILFRDL